MKNVKIPSSKNNAPQEILHDSSKVVEVNITQKNTSSFTHPLNLGLINCKNLLHSYNCENDSSNNKDFSVFKPFAADLSENDTPYNIILKLSKKNLKAMDILGLVLIRANEIDPLVNFFFYTLQLDRLGIYEEHIDTLYTNVCHSNIVNFLAVLRATQIAIISKEELYSSILNKDNKTNLYQIKFMLKKQLPEFNILEHSNL